MINNLLQGNWITWQVSILDFKNYTEMLDAYNKLNSKFKSEILPVIPGFT